MKNLIFQIVGSFLLVVLFSGCVEIINPNIPQLSNDGQRAKMKASNISIPISINLEEISKILNEELPRGTIYSQDWTRISNTKSYKYEIIRNDNIILSANGNEITVQIPLRIKASGAYKACIGYWSHGNCCSAPLPWPLSGCVPGITETEHGDAQPSVMVTAKIKVNMLENYTAKVDTSMSGNVFGDTHVHIDLIGDLIKINIDIKDSLQKKLNEYLNKNRERLENKLNQEIAKINIKDELQKIWIQLKEPKQIDQFYVDIVPQQVYVNNLLSSDEKLKIVLGLGSEITLSDTKPSSNSLPLPEKLKIDQIEDNKFHLYIPSNIKMLTLTEELKKEIIGKVYTKDDMKVEFTNFEIYGAALNKISVIILKAYLNAEVHGKKFKGYLYFTGVPNIDNENREIFINDFKIDPVTNSYLVNKGLPFFIDNFYYKQIQEKLKYSFQKDYDKYLKLANEKISHIKINDQISLISNIEQILVPSIYADENILELLFVIDGKAEIEFN